MAVVGRKGFTFVPVARIVATPHIAIPTLNTASARPGQSATAWPKIGIGLNQLSTRTTMNAAP